MILSRSWGAVALAAAGLALATTLIPGEADRVGLMMRDGASEAALQLNETLLSGAPGDPVLLHRAFLLRGAAGEVAGATDAAERLFVATGGDIAARRQLAEHYFMIGEMAKRADLLLGADPALLTARERDRLLGELRYSGRYDDERTQLERMAALGLLDSAQMARLGMVLASGGAVDSAIVHLSAHDDLTGHDSLYARLTLLHLLVGRNRLDEASIRARHWYRNWTDPDAKEAIRDIFDAEGIDWTPP